MVHRGSGRLTIGAIGGLATGGVMKWIYPEFKWGQVALIAIGWEITSREIGGRIMLWQFRGLTGIEVEYYGQV